MAHATHCSWDDKISFNANFSRLQLLIGMGGLILRTLLEIGLNLDTHDYAGYVSRAATMPGGYLTEPVYDEVQYTIAIMFVQLLYNEEDKSLSSTHYATAAEATGIGGGAVRGTKIIATIRDEINDNNGEILMASYFGLIYQPIGESCPSHYLTHLVTARADLQKMAPKSPLIPSDTNIFLTVLYQLLHFQTYAGAHEHDTQEAVRKLRDYSINTLALDGVREASDSLKFMGEALRTAEHRIKANASQAIYVNMVNRSFAGTTTTGPTSAWEDPLQHLPFSKRSVGLLLRNPDAKMSNGRPMFRGDRSTKCWNCGKMGHSTFGCPESIHENGDHYKPGSDADAPEARVNHVMADLSIAY